MALLKTAHLVLAAGQTGQDRLLILRVGAKIVIGIADGAGGSSGGAEAADLAISMIRSASSSLHSPMDFERLLNSADKQIEKDACAGETTVVVAAVSASGVVGASVGDSGAWLTNEDRIDDLTGRQIRKPLIGTGVACPISFARSNATGSLLVATDGLFKYASREAIHETLKKSEFESAPADLVALVRYSSGALPDDIAIILCSLQQ